jgi:hypothetical protein
MMVKMPLNAAVRKPFQPRREWLELNMVLEHGTRIWELSTSAGIMQMRYSRKILGSDNIGLDANDSCRLVHCGGSRPTRRAENQRIEKLEQAFLVSS